jgi:hypothetical protein
MPTHGHRRQAKEAAYAVVNILHPRASASWRRSRSCGAGAPMLTGGPSHRPRRRHFGNRGQRDRSRSSIVRPLRCRPAAHTQMARGNTGRPPAHSALSRGWMGRASARSMYHRSPTPRAVGRHGKGVPRADSPKRPLRSMPGRRRAPSPAGSRGPTHLPLAACTKAASSALKRRVSSQNGAWPRPS